MEIRSLELHNFRNYERASLRFEEKLNFFVGENASGKTSLLEALAYISLGRSFRGVNDADLIRQGEKHFFIRCELRDRNDHVTRFEVGVETGPSSRKKIKRDGVVLKRTSQMLGSLVCVVFTPEDLALVQSGHQERRAYIDYVLGSVDGEYLESLLQFNRALKQRNELLRRIQENKARLDDLLPWDDIFVRHAVTVQRKRRDFLLRFEPVVLRSVERISGLKDVITLKLDTSLDERGEESLRERMKQRRFDEVRAGHSLLGPHRDRLYFLESSGEEIGRRFSQGQKRTLALSLKVAQFYYLKEHIGRPPVLLVDDVLQELDIHRRRAFLEVLDDCGQAFFTTPDFDADQALFQGFPSSRIFVVENGTVSEK
ncbi:DNA replication/repair protein RecF [Leptonema illini]|uniref:DNA replication and repair protein RecF n=1 Tax=Leptonema illini DSM 21528 TaxID=929563 RepID=H2CGM8_9LEPT|nr:DNA replication/repair protein RecF [Leptonema illini]EHQ07945.1 DNA replication and repair protein RecF [Leptonema illini DSM 21528]